MDTITNFLGGSGGQGLGQVLGTASQMYGQQNAAEAQTNANLAAINTQNQFLGNIGGIYSPYTTAGAGAAGALAKAEGIGGAAPDYSGFENMPGYQFAIQQGTQAIQRQASAQGNAYTPNEAQAVGQYVTGTAMQDYNTYIGQLQATANMGETAANQIGNLTYNTGANISNLQVGTGQAQAGMYTGMGQTLGGTLGAGGSGVLGGALGGGGASGLIGAFGNIAKGLGGMFGGDGSTPTPAQWNGPGSTYSGYTPSGYASGMDPNNPWANGSDPSGSLYVPGAGQGGNAGYIDASGNQTQSYVDPTAGSTGWGGYVDNSGIDYSGYTGG